MIAHSPAIRHATVADAQAIAELHIRAWQWAYKGLLPDEYLAGLSETLERRVTFLRDRLSTMPDHARSWLIEQEVRLVGFAVTNRSGDDDASATTAEVSALYLAPEAVGRGSGRVLFAHAVEDFRQRGFEQATLWVLANNRLARRFYEAAGWSP